MALTLRSVGRPDRAGDRARVPRRARPRWSGASSARGARSPTRGSRSASRPTSCSPSASPASCASSTSLYTEGHTATRAEPVAATCEEAIRLARLLARLMPDEDETLGLLALLLLTDARRPARLDAHGDARRARATRTARGGTPSASREGLAVARPRAAARPARARTSSRPRSPRCTRRRPTFDGHGLAADRRPLRRARAPRPVTGRDRQPSRRGRPRRRTRRPAWRSSTASPTTHAWSATGRCTPRAPTCCAAPATQPVPTRRTRAPSR